MITAWRIDKAGRSKRKAFSGQGAMMAGGRWNHDGTRIVYTSESLSLAAFEKFVHMGDEGRSLRLVSYQIKIPTGLRMDEIKRKNLPIDWKAVPASKSTRDIGTNWVDKGASSILKVPSVVIEAEHNFLLNPFHTDFKRLTISAPAPFWLDPRMWKS